MTRQTAATKTLKLVTDTDAVCITVTKSRSATVSLPGPAMRTAAAILEIQPTLARESSASVLEELQE